MKKLSPLKRALMTVELWQLGFLTDLEMLKLMNWLEPEKLLREIRKKKRDK